MLGWCAVLIKVYFFWKIASFLWVEIVLNVYWPVSCGRNGFLAPFSTCPAIFLTSLSSIHAQIASRVSVCERVKEFEHEYYWERVRNNSWTSWEWSQETISAKWDRPVQLKITIFTQKNIVFYYG